MDDIKPGKSPTKIERVLEALIQKPMTRFDAEIIGCHCLNSSISSLQNQYVLNVARRPVTRSGRFGVIHCNEYWISTGERERAYRLLNYFRKKRGAQSVEVLAA
jgi:hypothetical protein